ncbi:MAG: hypothetical protein VX438_09280, partial [Planctomycetota bacterium]|nr:hypothetical protein [Planctomycetota bacterium]
KQAVIKIKRTNLAERLYRITGTGIYRDTRLLGLQPPIDLPAMNSRVLGSDSVVNAIYRDKLYWFWGDTNRLKYPLGNFQVTGATSPLPESINPSNGIELNYFTGPDGFTRPMAPVQGKGPTWIFGVFVTHDPEGKPRLVAKYEKVRQSMAAYQRGLVLFDDATQQFKKWVEFELQAPLFPAGQSLQRVVGERNYVFFATPFPLVRVLNDFKSIQDTRNYEAYTYFKPGKPITRDKNGKLQVTADHLERDANQKLVTHWKKKAHPLSPQLEQQLVQQKLIQRDEAISLLSDRLADPEPKSKTIILSSGSVAWNAYRKKWILIAVQAWGTSMLGELWYAEADQPEGPWSEAIKIVSHDNYSFYNPRHHPYFDQDGGKTIFFEGTYTKSFSGTQSETPWYDYNQIMYKLDLEKIRFPTE